jgi:hypothetical protein
MELSMRSERAAIIIQNLILVTLFTGCVGRGPGSQYTPIVVGVPSTQTANGEHESLRRLHFGGVYVILGHSQIEGPHTYEVQTNNQTAFADMTLEIKFLPVPYGIRARITNNRPESIVLDGSLCSLIDFNGFSHLVELRDPGLLSPDQVPGQ